MIDGVVTPSPLTVLRRTVVRMWVEPDNRSTLVGLAGMLLIHLLLLLIAPHLGRLGSSVPLVHTRPTHQFDIEITPEALVPPPPKMPSTPKQFVETNPDAPQNIPDKTNNFAAANQQVAQPKPTPNGDSERPAMEGKKDFQSTQIVSGRLEKPAEQVTPPEPMAPPRPAAAASAAPQEQNPLPGFEKTEGTNPDTYGSNVAPQTASARPIPNRVEGQPNAPTIDSILGPQPAIDPRHPRPRPSIVKQQQVRPAILAENKLGTSNIGIIAINAKFNNYGAYLQRMIEAIQLEWDKLVENSETYPPQGSFVTVHFFINSEGRIARFGDIESHSSDIGSRLCTAAISSRAPYGEWTDDMKAALNADGEELIFTFYYQ